MIKEFTNFEVRKALFAMDNNKAPNLDGFGAIFLQEGLDHCW